MKNLQLLAVLICIALGVGLHFLSLSAWLAFPVGFTFGLGIVHFQVCRTSDDRPRSWSTRALRRSWLILSLPLHLASVETKAKKSAFVQFSIGSILYVLAAVQLTPSVVNLLLDPQPPLQKPETGLLPLAVALLLYWASRVWLKRLFPKAKKQPWG